MLALTNLPSRRIGSTATACLLVAYFVLALWGTVVFGGRTAPTAVIWPASGVGLALVLLRGIRVWPFLFAAALASSALALDELSPLALFEVLLSGATSVLEPLVAGWLIWRVAGERFAERAPPFILAMLVAVPIAAFAAAAPLAVGELSAGVSTARAELGFLGAWYSAAVADLMGMLVLAPPIWIWLRYPRGGQIARPRAAELLLFAGAAVAVFALPDAAQARYLLVAVHLAVALRFPLQWSAAAVGLTSLAYLALGAFAMREQPFQDIYAPFLDNVGFVIILNLVTYVTALFHTETQTRLAQVSELADHLGQAEERERQRISKVLHDNLQQMLVAAKLGLAQCSGGPVERVQSNIDEAIEVARTLSAELYPPGLEYLPFAAALERLAQRTQELTGLEIQVEAHAGAEPGSAGMRSFLYLALRELLMNVAKHAETDRAWLRLHQAGDWLQAEVEDRGKGCDPEQLDQIPGEGTNHGASALRRRVELLGGQFEMTSENGCRVRLIVPVLR